MLCAVCFVLVLTASLIYSISSGPLRAARSFGSYHEHPESEAWHPHSGAAIEHGVLHDVVQALAHQEKLVSKDAREERTKAKRNEAKSLWGASKADTNKFAALAT